MAKRRRKPLNKVSFQLTDEQLAWLQRRVHRLGLVSDAEGYRDVVRTLKELEEGAARLQGRVEGAA